MADETILWQDEVTRPTAPGEPGFCGVTKDWNAAGDAFSYVIFDGSPIGTVLTSEAGEAIAEAILRDFIHGKRDHDKHVTG